MAENLIDLIRENVIQGRVNQEDEGLEEGMVGQPAVTELVTEALAQNIDVRAIINEGLTKGMDVVGKKFEAGEYFIPDMLASAEAVGVAMEMLGPHLEKSGIKSKGKILIATVKGDLHDIGKNIVSILLRGAGYTVKDLGNDIDTQTIVDAESGLRDSVKVIIGGAPVSEEFAQRIGADGFGADGFQAVAVVESLSTS